MVGTVLDLAEMLDGKADRLAVAISNTHVAYQQFRDTWLSEKVELRNYLFATSTTTTSNAHLPWKNSTTVPKLTQIRDNLHANYMASLFPNEDWLRWEGNDEASEKQTKRSAIENYMKTKLRQDRAEITFSQLVLDWIDYGNVFAGAEWIDEAITTAVGEVIRGYIGPRAVRISPYDITFNPLAVSFKASPKIIRSLKSFGEIAKKINDLPDDHPEKKPLADVINKSLGIRQAVGQLTIEDTLKAEGFIMDGFSDAKHYYGSDYIEILTFYGDLYDVDSGEFFENHIIKVIDRTFILSKTPSPNATAGSGIFHTGWRQRPDNLYAMGPLDNLVGMQYRIDHLENLKADVFDLIAVPVQKITGMVEDYEYGPGAKIYVGDDGDVEFLTPDATALNADIQIERLEARMEELAGAPKEAMGIRTPGEKTKFEVQKLDNAASRIFQNKISHFEMSFLDPLVNFMLQLSQQNMTQADVARTLDSEIDVILFQTVSKEDIIANGILRPQGASHFARRANLLQNIIGLTNSGVAQDPAVNVHLSGKKLAKLLEELSDLQQFDIYEPNIRVLELAETQRLADQAQERTETAAITPGSIGEANDGPEPEQEAQ